MAQALKDIYNKDYFDDFLRRLSDIEPISSQDFFALLYTKDWEHYTLTQRFTHIAKVLNACLPYSYAKQIHILCEFTKQHSEIDSSDWKLAYLWIPEFIQVYGLDSPEVSYAAIETVTQFTSCEFAIRPFIIEYPEQSLLQMLAWSSHSHPLVRRLSSEGCRPRLPWAPKLDIYIQNPNLIIPILENLKTDTVSYVQTSVANNINDISKDNPDCAISLCKTWKMEQQVPFRIISHGLRTLTKSGNIAALEICNIAPSHHIHLKELRIQNVIVTPQAKLAFECHIENTDNNPKQIKIEYAVYFLRKHTSHTKKVFYLTSTTIAGNSGKTFKKTHSFKKITTRVYYPGKQYVSIIINGKEYPAHEFEFCLSK